jgi:hypothetical protein
MKSMKTMYAFHAKSFRCAQRGLNSSFFNAASCNDHYEHVREPPNLLVGLSIPCPFLVHSLSPHIPNTLYAIDMSPSPRRTPSALRAAEGGSRWHLAQQGERGTGVAVKNNGCATEQYLPVGGGIGSSPKDVLRSVALRNPCKDVDRRKTPGGDQKC